MAEEKLTKKQRKTRAFRESQKGEGDAVQSSSNTKTDKGKQKEKEKENDDAVVQSSAPAEIATATVNQAKKRKRGTSDDNGPKPDEMSGSGSGKRFIVFVGNMSFKTTSDQVAKHFQDHCGEAPSVRLLTSKADPTKAAALSKSKQKSIVKGKAQDPGAAKSRGCAFVEFASRDALQKALQFHHTALHGRTINVELTAGGGGKGAERKEKIEKKNRDLEAERKKLHEKYVKNGSGATAKKAKTQSNGPTTDETGPKKPQWGPNADKSGKGRLTTAKVPKWAASGANAVRLNG